LLVVVHPRDITEQAQYAIDQFVMRGGKLIAFLDPLCYFDPNRQSGNPMMGGGPPSSSSLDRLLKAWGIEMDKSKVVADMTFTSRMRRGNRAEEVPTILSITKEGVNDDDVVTSQLGTILAPFVGAFSGTPAEGLKQTVLIKSSSNSQLADGFMAQLSSEQIAKEFKSAGKEFAVGIRLAGKFKTAFPEGKPGSPADKPAEAKPEASLKETAAPNTVVLVADADLLTDQCSLDMEQMGQLQAFFGQRVLIPRGGNLGLVENLADQMAGDSNLIGARSRSTVTRPLTLMKKMQAQAEDKYRNKQKELEDSLSEAQRKLNELQRNKPKDQRFILSAEQQKEIDNFRKKESDVKQELKSVRKNLRHDIDSLEIKLKAWNIAGMPVFVTLSGIALAIFKRKRTAAK